MARDDMDPTARALFQYYASQPNQVTGQEPHARPATSGEHNPTANANLSSCQTGHLEGASPLDAPNAVDPAAERSAGPSTGHATNHTNTVDNNSGSAGNMNDSNSTERDSPQQHGSSSPARSPRTVPGTKPTSPIVGSKETSDGSTDTKVDNEDGAPAKRDTQPQAPRGNLRLEIPAASDTMKKWLGKTDFKDQVSPNEPPQAPNSALPSPNIDPSSAANNGSNLGGGEDGSNAEAGCFARLQARINNMSPGHLREEMAKKLRAWRERKAAARDREQEEQEEQEERRRVRESRTNKMKRTLRLKRRNPDTEDPNGSLAQDGPRVKDDGPKVDLYAGKRVRLPGGAFLPPVHGGPQAMQDRENHLNMMQSSDAARDIRTGDADGPGTGPSNQDGNDESGSPPVDGPGNSTRSQVVLGGNRQGMVSLML